MQEPQISQVEHHLRYTSGKISTNGRMRPRTIRQNTDQPRHLAIHSSPIFDCRASQTSGVSDRWNVQK